MRRLVQLVRPGAAYQARLHAVQEENTDSVRCAHPNGALSCERIIACANCPFSEVLEFDEAA